MPLPAGWQARCVLFLPARHAPRSWERCLPLQVVARPSCTRCAGCTLTSGRACRGRACGGASIYRRPCVCPCVCACSCGCGMWWAGACMHACMSSCVASEASADADAPAVPCVRPSYSPRSTSSPAAYVGSVLATLYAALMMHSYLLSLMCSGLQVGGARQNRAVRTADGRLQIQQPVCLPAASVLHHGRGTWPGRHI